MEHPNAPRLRGMFVVSTVGDYSLVDAPLRDDVEWHHLVESG